jgi:tetratricopeptide (TPR) repeat protein
MYYRARLSGFLLCVIWLLFANHALAQEVCEPVVGAIASVEGLVEVERAGTFVWQTAELGQALCEADAVRVGPRSRAALRLVNDAVLRLDQNTTLQLTDIRTEPEERSFLQLIAGVLQSFSRRPRLLAINTPYLNATIEGTEFVIASDERQGSITVLEGIVTAANELGEVRLVSGEAAVAAAGQAPEKRIVVRPRDAVQWALYYPPILAAVGGQADVADLPPALAEAMRRANAGDLEGAFAVLDDVPEGERDAQYHVYRAGLLLSVGQVDEAEDAIDQALAREPNSGLAYAQRSIIELVRNEKEAALASAQRAVELRPEASAPKIALSYALQANFQIEAARDTLLQAVEQNPNDALAWARLSELWLMLGDRRRAREAAERAVALAPDIERTQNVLGFANLVEFRTGSAKEVFERAIALAPADPLPRLGLGLAQIREGDLAQGRENLEVAVGLNANDALLRAYLGKAYFEEERNDIANEQYAIAQELDRLDPTAWLYEAIKQQTENRPGEALQNLQKSIELNDNRAVYRSRLLLDSDRAARGTSLARIYDDLGFEELGALEASRSLTLDPANASAHRFLSDAYGGVRRRESARVSELLQAQMLQDININPVQPSVSETNLNIVTQGGPADAGFSEFTPLFERERAQVNATGLVGNDDTYGGEGVVSMLFDRYSISAGAFRYETDGWRENHDIEHDIQNVFFQAAITPELNAQVEFRHRETDNGDLDFNFDPDDFFPNFEQKVEQDSARLGLRYSPALHSDLLLSFIYSDRREDQSDQFDTFFGPGELEGEAEDDGYQFEGQYIFRQDTFNITAGAAHYDFDTEIDAFLAAGGIPFVDVAESSDLRQTRGYTYGSVNLPEPVTWTVGVSYDDYEEGDFEQDEVNPKFGVRWDVIDRLQLRAAVFQSVKPALASNRTLEPTQVAGFNQLFDDSNGTKALRYGVGLDYSPLDNVFLGAEATRRDLDTPVFDDTLGRTATVDQEEENLRGYINWTPFTEWALSAEVAYDRFESDSSILTVQDTVPEELETFSIPLTVRYFHPTGFFAGVRGTYVNQDVDRSPDQIDGLEGGQDGFFVVDLSAGYRLPKRLGTISLELSNLFDTGFQYQDDSFREFGDDPSIGPYIPERQILARVTISW